MVRTSRKQRFAMVAVSAAIVGGGVLLPTSAFAAQSAPQTVEQAQSGHDKHKHQNKGKKDHHKDKGKKHHGKKDKKHGKKNKVRDVENMPGCKFYQGKVYCEHKPDKPAPAPEKPAPAP
ncbi:hypothetical protein ACFWUZ_18285 [Streptomyces sp. NPDC058646]|uniref:hypothetical protein n=1 Tax=Streptomyces sp. NPDC058646 TaxID=3346574 RepID=UPI003652AC6F